MIGFTGKARHGKDTAAKQMMAVLDGAERFAFSDGIAAYCRAKGLMMDRDPRTLVRHGMVLRANNPWVWCDVLYGALQDRRPRYALLTGVRFDNEVALVRQMGGTLVRVVRAGHVAEDRDATHITETAQDDFTVDHTIMAYNLDELTTLARYLAEDLRDRRFPPCEHYIYACRRGKGVVDATA